MPELGFAVSSMTCRVGPAGPYQEDDPDNRGSISLIVTGRHQRTVDYLRAKSTLYCLCGECIASTKESAAEQLQETAASAEQSLADLSRESQRCDFGCLISFVVLLVAVLFIFKLGSSALAPAAAGAVLALALGLFTATKGEEVKNSLPDLSNRVEKAREYAAICGEMTPDDFFAAASSASISLSGITVADPFENGTADTIELKAFDGTLRVAQLQELINTKQLAWISDEQMEELDAVRLVRRDGDRTVLNLGDVDFEELMYLRKNDLHYPHPGIKECAEAFSQTL
jgi:hypothetical protein